MSNGYCYFQGPQSTRCVLKNCLSEVSSWSCLFQLWASKVNIFTRAQLNKLVISLKQIISAYFYVFPKFWYNAGVTVRELTRHVKFQKHLITKGLDSWHILYEVFLLRLSQRRLLCPFLAFSDHRPVIRRTCHVLWNFKVLSGYDDFFHDEI